MSAITWDRSYPFKQGDKCPLCSVAFFKEKSLRSHVIAHDKQNALIERWAISVCQQVYDTKLGVASHFRQTHAGVTRDSDSREQSGASQQSSVTARESDTEEANTTDGLHPPTSHTCNLCNNQFPTLIGLRNHERAYHQAAISASLASQGNPSQPGYPRLPWSKEEIQRFVEAAQRVGLHSNKSLASLIGTRTQKQVANFKARYIRDHQQWAFKYSTPAAFGTRQDQATQSSPSQSPSSQRSVSTHSTSFDSDVATTLMDPATPSSSSSGHTISPIISTKTNPRIDAANQLLVRLRSKEVDVTNSAHLDVSTSNQPSVRGPTEEEPTSIKTSMPVPSYASNLQDVPTPPLNWDNDPDITIPQGSDHSTEITGSSCQSINNEPHPSSPKARPYNPCRDVKSSTITH